MTPTYGESKFQPLHKLFVGGREEREVFASIGKLNPREEEITPRANN